MFSTFIEMTRINNKKKNWKKNYKYHQQAYTATNETRFNSNMKTKNELTRTNCIILPSANINPSIRIETRLNTVTVIRPLVVYSMSDTL